MLSTSPAGNEASSQHPNWSFLVGNQNIPDAEEVKQRNKEGFLRWLVAEAEKGEVIRGSPDVGWVVYKFPVQWQSGTPQETTEDCYALVGDCGLGVTVPSLSDVVEPEELLKLTMWATELFGLRYPLCKHGEAGRV
ncbi:hypothetical protein TWF281_002157 [Arthrobotrys megalospora]